jgi:hypothetical protein
MMLTTPETVAEAKQALNEFLQRERHASLARSRSPQRDFSAEGGSDMDFDNRDELGPILNEARESARRYIESKSKNARPIRFVDEKNPAAVEGQIQALSWLKRRGKSRLKA